MKRSAAACALACACACTAHAQSSLTVFGIVDAALAFGRGSVAHRTQLASSGLHSSRLGFRGIEDLGGELSAGFWLEAGLNNDDGRGAPTNATNQGTGAVPTCSATSNAGQVACTVALNGAQGLTFNRRSTLSLAHKRWGELRAGRDFTPHFLSAVLYDPFGATGPGANQLVMGQTAAGAPWAAQGGTNSPAVRSSNGITYFLPHMTSGVYGSVQHYFGENASNSAGARAGTGTSARMGWKRSGTDVSLAYGRTRYSTGTITSTSAGISHAFGGLKLSAAYARDTVDGAAPSGRGWLVGATWALGADQLLASYSIYRTSAATSPGASKLALGFVHSLSKRSAVYAIAARLDNRGTSAQSLNGAVTAPGRSSTGIDFGVRHAF
jgi:predicted porin